MFRDKQKVFKFKLRVDVDIKVVAQNAEEAESELWWVLESKYGRLTDNHTLNVEILEEEEL